MPLKTDNLQSNAVPTPGRAFLQDALQNDSEISLRQLIHLNYGLTVLETIDLNSDHIPLSQWRNDLSEIHKNENELVIKRMGWGLTANTLLISVGGFLIINVAHNLNPSGPLVQTVLSMFSFVVTASGLVFSEYTRQSTRRGFVAMARLNLIWLLKHVKVEELDLVKKSSAWRKTLIQRMGMYPPISGIASYPDPIAKRVSRLLFLSWQFMHLIWLIFLLVTICIIWSK
ncbi:MAG: hypothetical protein AAF086_09875 [Planctomycetota bacterium]